jgi:hypothetical protein
MKKLFSVLLFALSFSLNVQAFEPGQVIIDQASEVMPKRDYVVFTPAASGALDPVFEVFAGKKEDVLTRHCARFMVRACGESGAVNNAAYDRLANFLGSKPIATNPACRAWNEDCEDIDIAKIKKTIDDLKKEEDEREAKGKD